MPMPTEERVSQLVAGLVERRGFDLEGVEISTSGKHADVQARVKVTVDSDGAVDLDSIATLSSELSLVLDDAGDFGETPYLLEVSTPGIDRPLTHDRHWRRAQGRKVRVTLRDGASAPEPGAASRFEGRVGALTDGSVALVLGGKRNPHRVKVPLADIAEAIVQAEFSTPGPRELELAGGVAPGRPTPGQDADEGRGTTDAVSVTATELPTEGIVE